MTRIPNQQTFQEAYAGEAPWDIGRIQPAFAAIADQVKDPILDAGCGTGDMALYFAAKGHQVVGIDYLEEPIRRAARRPRSEILKSISSSPTPRNSPKCPAPSIQSSDSGLFHVFTDDDRRKYVAGLAHVLNAGGRVFLMCFRNEEPGESARDASHARNCRRPSLAGWQIEWIEPSHFEINPKFTGATFSEGGPKTSSVTARLTNKNSK